MTVTTQQSILDAHYMARAIELARNGLYTTHPNPRVGCVIVRDGQIVGEGWHVRTGEPHAEVHALRAAGEQVYTLGAIAPRGEGAAVVVR